MMRSSKRGAVTLPPAPAVSLFTTRYRDRVACAVLPEDPTDPARTRWSLPVAALLAAALVAAALVALLWPRGDHSPLDVIWAEDGAVVLLPTANFEVLDNTANMHWLLFYAVLCVLLWRPVTRADHLIGGLVAAVGVASEPLALALLPVAVLGAWALPRRMYATVIGFAAGAVAQLTAMSSDHPATVRGAPIGQAGGAWLVWGPHTTLGGRTPAPHPSHS